MSHICKSYLKWSLICVSYLCGSLLCLICVCVLSQLCASLVWCLTCVSIMFLLCHTLLLQWHHITAISSEAHKLIKQLAAEIVSKEIRLQHWRVGSGWRAWKMPGAKHKHGKEKVYMLTMLCFDYVKG